MPKLQIDFDVKIDEDGIVDGRVLARDLIETAFCLLVPYVNACHACADNLFTGIANGKLAELHEHGHATGTLEGYLYRPGLPEDIEAIRRHLDAAEESTQAMMWKGDQHTHH